MCHLRHINDPVLSSLKMEGIRLLLALDGAFFALAGAAYFFSADFTAAFFGALAFFTLAALCFFILGADAASPRAGAAGTAAFCCVVLFSDLCDGLIPPSEES
jgi:hypothetical protein